MKTTLHLLLFLLPIFVHARGKGSFDEYDWETNPSLYIPSSEEIKEDALVVFEKQVNEYRYGGAFLNRYELVHIKKYLQTDIGIEQNNKFYIWAKNNRKIFKLKARVIQPSGKIVELSEADMIESKNESGETEYYYFAFEGIEKGSVIEYLHYMHYEDVDYANHYSVDVNGSLKKKRFEFSILYEKRWFTVTSFGTNGLAPMTLNDTDGNLQRFDFVMEDIDRVRKERYSFDSKTSQKIICNVDVRRTIIGYNSIVGSLYSLYLIGDGFDHEEQKLTLIEKAFGMGQDTSGVLKIKALENAIKSENNTITEKKPLEIMIELAREFGIKCELVLTSDRREIEFEKEYENRIFLHDIMLFFPEYDVYYYPAISSRIGPAPYKYIANNGLFVPMEKMKSRLSMPYSIKFIASPSIDYSTDNIRTAVTIDPVNLQSTIQLDRSVSGYFAEPYQAEMSLLTAEQLREVKEQFFTYVLTKSATLGDYTFENDNSAAFNDKPLVGHVTATSSSLVSEAGDKLLVNIGTLIGPQSNMYQEKPETRQSPVDLDYLHRYSREIRLTIPEGYKAVNVADLNRNVKPDPALTIGFTSRYRLNGNELVIYIEEWYNQLTYPKEQYGYVVDVFNAAADFNALTLVLEKQ